MRRKIFGSILALVCLGLAVGPAGARIPTGPKWTFTTGGGIASSPALAMDGTIYVGSQDGNLYAIRPDGTKKWIIDIIHILGGMATFPIVAADGTIYVCGRWRGLSALHALNPDGSSKQSFTTIEVSTPPALGADGSVYFGWGGDLYALHPNGVKKWTFPSSDGFHFFGLVTVGADGTIYAGSNNFLYAVKPDGTQKWVFEDTNKGYIGSSVMGADGTIYVGAAGAFTTLYALNPNGIKKWAFYTGDSYTLGPVLAADGTIYLIGDSGYLYAIRTDGSLKWALYTGGPFSRSTPAVGANGTIYLGTNDGNLYAVNPDGSLKWIVKLGNSPLYDVTLAPDGTIYVCSWEGKLYAVYSDSPGLANSSWPMYQHDPGHTGRLGNWIRRSIKLPILNLLLGN